MTTAPRPDVDSIPADLDRFLGVFFSKRGWHSQIRFDPAGERLYLEVRLASGKLSSDDRFFSLVEYFVRAQDALLRERAGVPLQCRMYTAGGHELTPLLHARGSSYLDDNARGSGMRRRLAWLGIRRRVVGRIVPGAIMWAATIVFVVGVLGFSLTVTTAIALCALALQAGLLVALAGPRR